MRRYGESFFRRTIWGGQDREGGRRQFVRNCCLVLDSPPPSGFGVLSARPKSGRGICVRNCRFVHFPLSVFGLLSARPLVAFAFNMFLGAKAPLCSRLPSPPFAVERIAAESSH